MDASMPVQDVVAASERIVDKFNMQGMANTAWAMATAGHSAVQLCAVWTTAEGQYVGELSAQELRMTLWTLSRCENLKNDDNDEDDDDDEDGDNDDEEDEDDRNSDDDLDDYDEDR